MYYKSLLLLHLLCVTLLANAQNLVKNPGFEEHTPVICIGCHAQHEFFSHVSQWHNSGWGAQFFSKKYVFKKSEIEKGYYPKDFLPRTGDGVVELMVRGTTAQSARKGGGGSSYLYTRLSKTLAPGTLYKLHFWLKIKNETVQSDERFRFLRHFGMDLSDKVLQVNEQSQLLRSYTPFLLDTVISGKWIEVDYIIRPTSPLNYLTLGWFEHPLHPVYWRNDDANHWINILVDDISVTPILQPVSRDSTFAIDYPSQKPLKGMQAETIEIANTASVCAVGDSINVYFDTKTDTLSALAKSQLDSFILCLKKDTIATGLYVRGFTDAVGSSFDNDALSARRACAVKQYLAQHHYLPELQIMVTSHGEDTSDDAIIKNKPEHQRRVEIVKSGISLSNLMYRKLSFYALKGQSDSAFYWLKAWIKRPESDKILLLLDPELSILHADNRWKAVCHLVRESYQKYAAPSTAFEMDSMYLRDQFFRSLPSILTEMKGYTPDSLDLTLAQSRHLDTIYSEKYISYLVERLDKYGWPSPELVGERAATAPAMILIHSRDLAIRKKYLPMVETALKTKKLKPEWYAMLFDKIMMDEKGVQFYATQYKPDKDDPTVYRLAPIENPELVNERRAAIGMYPKDMSFNWFKVVERTKK